MDRPAAPSKIKAPSRPLLWLLALILTLSCAVPTSLVPAPDVPTVAPGGIDTIVAQTAAAAATQTATLIPLTETPSLTPTPELPTAIPTNTETPIPSITPTFLFILPSLTATLTPVTPSVNYACRLMSQSPADDSAMGTSQDFEVNWTVMNTGFNTWDSNSIDFIYFNGDKLTKSKSADLPQSVAPGEKVTLTLTMTSPKTSGTYRTVWALQLGKNQFCKVSLEIDVR